MLSQELEKINGFFAQKDEQGVSNLEKAAAAQVIRRTADTDKSKSFEESDFSAPADYPKGVVVKDGKLIGLGIHIFNEDVYPLQSFEIYLRGCGLTGALDISDCRDMIFLDLYRNKINSVKLGDMPAMRILGLQDNLIESLDPTGLPACQGIDAGKNRLRSIDVSKNGELAELYVNDNSLSEIDISHNHKLKYFYCHNNKICEIDARQNPLLRHMDCTGNPLVSVKAFAPMSEGKKPLELTAEKGGSVGLKFCPVYNAQWKETGEWKQSCFAYPDEGFVFEGWYENGQKISDSEIFDDVYGSGHILTAVFAEKKQG